MDLGPWNEGYREKGDLPLPSFLHRWHGHKRSLEGRRDKPQAQLPFIRSKLQKKQLFLHMVVAFQAAENALSCRPRAACQTPDSINGHLSHPENIPLSGMAHSTSLSQVASPPWYCHQVI